MIDQIEYDIEALKGAAKFFEDMATGANPAPLAFSQAIRRVIADCELEAEMAADFADDWQATEVVQSSWERFKASMPVAKVINDNQPYNQAIVQVLRDPATLPVGTLLYASQRGAEDNAIVLAALMEPKP